MFVIAVILSIHSRYIAAVHFSLLTLFFLPRFNLPLKHFRPLGTWLSLVYRSIPQQ